MALKFNGTNQYAYRNESISDNELTIIGYVKFNSSIGSTPAEYFCFDNYTSTNYRGVFCQAVSNQFRGVRITDDVTANTVLGSSIETSRWYHFALTYNKSQRTLKLYIDNVAYNLFGLALKTTTIQSITLAAIRRSGAVGFFTPCSLAYLRVYTRELSAREISDAYNYNIYSDNGLFAYWPLDSDSLDYSGNSRHLTLVNSPIYESRPELPQSSSSSSSSSSLSSSSSSSLSSSISSISSSSISSSSSVYVPPVEERNTSRLYLNQIFLIAGETVKQHVEKIVCANSEDFEIHTGVTIQKDTYVYLVGESKWLYVE